MVIVLGLGAAFLFALAAFEQRLAARRIVESGSAVMCSRAAVARLFAGLARSQPWLVGMGVNIGAFALQAAALSVGSVAMVQPLIAAELIFVVILISVSSRRWPAALSLVSALAVSGGLLLLLVTENRLSLSGPPQRTRILAATACALVTVSALIGLSRAATAWLASMLIGACAGLCQAISAVFIKMVAITCLSRGLVAALMDWPLYLLLVSVLSGVLLGQLSFASGRLPPAFAAMSVTNPVIGIALGLLAFEVSVPADPAIFYAMAAGGVLIVLGLIGLASVTKARAQIPARASRLNRRKPNLPLD